MAMKQREYKYDLLRVISMIAVIMIHVSATWVNGFSKIVAIRGGYFVSGAAAPAVGLYIQFDFKIRGAMLYHAVWSVHTGGSEK